MHRIVYFKQKRAYERRISDWSSDVCSSDLGGYWRAFDAKGESFIAGASVTHPLIRDRKVSLWLSGRLDYYSVDQWTSGSSVRRDRLTTASASLTGYVPMASGRLRELGRESCRERVCQYVWISVVAVP